MNHFQQLNDRKTSRVRAAFTFVEVLVAMAVVGILVILLLPAVVAVRESARRTSCGNNLKQFGLAISNYTSIHNVFPKGENAYSIHANVLPYLDESNLFNSINFSKSSSSDNSFVFNFTSSYVSVSGFICPSDTSFGFGGGTNYVGNWGFGFSRYGPLNNGPFASPGGIPAIGYSSVSDGSSQTAAMSEICRGVMSSPDPKPSVFSTSKKITGVNQLDEFVALCNDTTPGSTLYVGLQKGTRWISQSLGQTLYNHNYTPNSYSCLNGTLVLVGSWPSGSYHVAGTNVLFIDGHVSYIKNSIVPQVWRAVGSMNAGDFVTYDF